MTDSKKSAESKTTKLDTSKHRTPNEDASKEPTPIADEVAAYLKGADEADLTHFEEDDDPMQFVGDLVDEDGVDDGGKS